MRENTIIGRNYDLECNGDATSWSRALFALRPFCSEPFCSAPFLLCALFALCPFCSVPFLLCALFVLRPFCSAPFLFCALIVRAEMSCFGRPTNSFKSFTCLPYIHGKTDKIQRVLNDVGIRVAMKPFVTIEKSLPSPKDPLDANKITGIIYQVLCHDCPFVYIGQTKEDLKSRLSEHKIVIKYQKPEKSALSEHSITLNHI